MYVPYVRRLTYLRSYYRATFAAVLRILGKRGEYGVNRLQPLRRLAFATPRSAGKVRGIAGKRRLV